MPRTARRLLTLACAALLAAPLLAYTVFLKDGSKIIAREPIAIEGDRAIIVLQNGTRTSIAAAEVDLERTREANTSALGSAVVIDEGTVTEIPSAAKAPPPRQRLSDLIASRQAGLDTRRGRAPSLDDGADLPAGPVADYRDLPRRPFASVELAGDVQRLFRAQNVDQVLIFQGSRPDRLRLDITTNSEAAVFRALRVTAAALLQARETYPGQVAAIELLLETSDREPAGQFEIGPDAARLLVDEAVEPSAFFIRRVRF